MPSPDELYKATAKSLDKDMSFRTPQSFGVNSVRNLVCHERLRFLASARNDNWRDFAVALTNYIIVLDIRARVVILANDMAKISQPPTPYAKVNVLLHRLLVEAQNALGENFFGMYLYGSLASGDFDEHSSDVDFVVVTRGEISDETIPALRALHERIAASNLNYASKLEGSYMPLAALRRYNPNDPPRPQYNEGEFFLAPHNADWIIQRYVLREHGVIVAGAPLKAYIGPVTPDELRGAVAGILNGWWATEILAHPEQLKRAGYQPYAVLTMCRSLYCFEHGAIVSKPVAARWAMENLNARWKPLIERAVTQQAALSPHALNETRALIQFSIERAKDYRGETA